MIETDIFSDNKAHMITASVGPFSVLEYQRDLSVIPEEAIQAYFASEMDVRKRQLVAKVDPYTDIIAQKGTMQAMLGAISAVTDIRDAGDLVKKYVGSKVTGERAIKPRYRGDGVLLLEPTFRYIILQDLKKWDDGMVVEDGLFLACTGDVDMRVSARSNVSSAVLGREGFFNTAFIGEGIVALESPVHQEELLEIRLKDDTVKIDGNMAIAWSKSLDFTVERTTPTLMGSLMSGEGLVNTYRGTGRILMAPVRENGGISSPTNRK